jgi:hypothetical protein
MERGLARGFRSRTAEEISGPRRLTLAESTAQQTGITAVTDLTGLAISFAHTRPQFEVEVHLHLAYVFGSVIGTITIAHITDSANTVLRSGPFTSGGSSHLGQIDVRYRITALGSYSLKGRLEGLVAGTSGNGAGTAEYVARLEAREVEV